jgi:hypothetical protein
VCSVSVSDPAPFSDCARRGRSVRCRKCDSDKPPRTHHCSMCNACFLRMDHHCPWVVGCVGFRNHKYFLNFLVWTSLLLAYVVLLQHALVWGTCLSLGPWFQPLLLPQYQYSPICSANVVVNYASMATLLGSVGSFACFHVFLSARNVTTIEFMDHLNGRGIREYLRINARAMLRAAACVCYPHYSSVLRHGLAPQLEAGASESESVRCPSPPSPSPPPLLQLLGQRPWTWPLPFYPWVLHSEEDGQGVEFDNKYEAVAANDGDSV